MTACAAAYWATCVLTRLRYIYPFLKQRVFLCLYDYNAFVIGGGKNLYICVLQNKIILKLPPPPPTPQLSISVCRRL